MRINLNIKKFSVGLKRTILRINIADQKPCQNQPFDQEEWLKENASWGQRSKYHFTEEFIYN
jgi:hypothetical protein